MPFSFVPVEKKHTVLGQSCRWKETKRGKLLCGKEKRRKGERKKKKFPSF